MSLKNQQQQKKKKEKKKDRNYLNEIMGEKQDRFID